MHELLQRQVLRRIEVFDPVVVSQWKHRDRVDAYGAVVLQFEREAIVIRSTLRYGVPELTSLLNGIPLWDPVVTVTGHEEAAALQRAIGNTWLGQEVGQPCGVQQEGAIIELDFGIQRRRIEYRPDIDGALVCSPPTEQPKISVIELTNPSEAFGWMLPKSRHAILWNGKHWPNLQVLWHRVERTAALREWTFQQLFALRLTQHPNILRRFAALQYPVKCNHWPWLAEQINWLRARRLVS